MKNYGDPGGFKAVTPSSISHANSETAYKLKKVKLTILPLTQDFLKGPWSDLIMKGFFESLVTVKYPNFRLIGKNPLMGQKMT